MISFSNVSKQHGRQILFIDASFQLNPGERVGLVGPNGAGKSTLFRMIVGEEAPDDGDVAIPKKMSIGYFRQEVDEMQGRSVLDEAIAGSGRLGDLHHELVDLEHAMSDPDRMDEMDAILERFGHVQEEYQHLGGYELESRARECLLGLGFAEDQIDGDVGALSGGWKMRVSMAKVLLGNFDVLLLDEPTNHLDIESILWLESFLKSVSSTLFMTSHDRDFMNRIVSKIVEIDGGDIVTYSGNYDFYLSEREIRETNQEAAYARQQAKLAKEQRFIDRFSAHAAKAAQVQSRVKALEKIEKLEPPKRRQVVHFDFRRPPRSGDEVATLEAVSKAYGRRVVHAGLSLILRRGERWCVMGRNGAGKTTLLRMVAGVLAPDSGSVRLGASLKLGYFAQQSLDLLRPELTIWEQFQQDFPHESVGALRNLLGAFQFSGDDVEKRIRALSGGEKSRLVLARMLYDPPNFLVLDEPTNHLDLATKEMLVEALRDFEGTMLFVSHDRTFLRGLANRVLELGGESGTEKEPHLYPGSYVEYVEKRVRLLSGGEKARLVLARMLYDPPNFLVLDEPTNHLDVWTKQMLIQALAGYEGTLLLVSHDRRFLTALTDHVLELAPEGPRLYGGGYAEYVVASGHEAPGMRG
ncbi:MAG TPA: ATP-binding cassette domain-containing protein [Gaiellaceae bacterium]|nr:ATP-binding cassette domain-containing protein [Gaiellaceae bacterium]